MGVAGTAIVVGGVGLTGTAALADTWTCYQYGPGLSCIVRGRITENRTHVQACDERADGQAAIVWYIDSLNVHRRVTDPNGSGANGCGHAYTSASNPVTYYRVCLGDDQHCKDWLVAS
jgi:hypothetical protein